MDRTHLFDPLALQGSICSICCSIGQVPQNVFGGALPQNVKNQRISRTWRPTSPFWIPKHDFRGPFWHHVFIIFVNVPKSRKVFVFKYFFRYIFSIWFPHYFSKPLLGTVVRWSWCRTFIDSLFWVPCSFSGFSKRHPSDHLFAQADENKRVAPTT